MSAELSKYLIKMGISFFKDSNLYSLRFPEVSWPHYSSLNVEQGND